MCLSLVDNWMKNENFESDPVCLVTKRPKFDKKKGVYGYSFKGRAKY